LLPVYLSRLSVQNILHLLRTIHHEIDSLRFGNAGRTMRFEKESGVKKI